MRARVEQTGVADRLPHHVCAAAIATGLALMIGAVPVVSWLVNQTFALTH